MTADSRVDPTWGDDLMAISDAVGVTTISPSGRLHPTAPGDLSDLVLALAVQTWAEDLARIPWLPTDHDVCLGCGDLLCGCDTACEDLEQDACGHDGRAYCPGCAVHWCVECRADQDRWDRPRGEDR